jgi:hypothetical protein
MGYAGVQGEVRNNIYIYIYIVVAGKPEGSDHFDDLVIDAI